MEGWTTSAASIDGDVLFTAVKLLFLAVTRALQACAHVLLTSSDPAHHRCRIAARQPNQRLLARRLS